MLPTFAQLSSRAPIPQHFAGRLPNVDPDTPHPDNLWRIHWRNAPDRRRTVPIPDHIVLPKALTGVDAPIVVMIGSRFPMIGAHKVLPAYAGLVVRLVTGGFDPARPALVSWLHRCSLACGSWNRRSTSDTWP